MVHPGRIERLKRSWIKWKMTININYNIMVQENKKLDKRYIKAKKRIDDLKEFYIHLITFIVMNAFLIFVKSAKVNGQSSNSLLFSRCRIIFSQTSSMSL